MYVYFMKYMDKWTAVIGNLNSTAISVYLRAIVDISKLRIEYHIHDIVLASNTWRNGPQLWATSIVPGSTAKWLLRQHSYYDIGEV